jgi:3-dehydroquinate dehydratase/shikimate dehydrogenase
MLFLSINNLKLPLPPSDGVELRLDMLPQINKTEIASFLKKLEQPIIFTLKNRTNGGEFIGSEKERLKILEELLTLQPTFVDLEHDISKEFIEHIAKKFPNIKIIISYHNFENTPHNLEEILKNMYSPFAHSYKIATMATSTCDALRMLLFVKNKKNVTGICMGEDGQITRILGPVFNNFIDYACVEVPLALGQLTFDELNIYHYHKFNPFTKLYGLIGDPVNKSISTEYHNAVNEKFNSVYVKMKITKEELPIFFPLAKKCGFLGLSVTMPLKEAVLPFLDWIDDDAKQIGAVNTLKLQDGKILGYNTDGKGALDGIEAKLKVNGKHIVVIGAGGAARAIIFEALKRGANVTIINRTKEKAQALAKYFECLCNETINSMTSCSIAGYGLDELTGLDYDIIINTTPSPMPIDAKYLIEGAIAMDIKTRPKITPFLEEAIKKKMTCIYGYEMFLNQAMEQCRIWQIPI